MRAIDGLAAVAMAMAFGSAAAAQATQTGAGDWRNDMPGRVHAINPASLPPPYLTAAAGNAPDVVARPPGARLSVPPGFHVSAYAEVPEVRRMRIAPDGSVFVAASLAGRIVVLAAADGQPRALHQAVFAAGLDRPYGIAFWPADHPRYVYVGEASRLVRYPWHVGATRPDGPAETILAPIGTSDHWTRDVLVSPDGTRLLLAVGSGSNDADGMGHPPAGFVASAPLGAAWGRELMRADVLSLDPSGHDVRVRATGLRNCAGMALHGDTLWCATNERDGLGDDLPPDYLTHVQTGGFYGWPWFYIGNHPDPDHAGERPDLAGRAILPDILIQPHSAPLGLVFYDGTLFPAAWRGQGFAALHGSWNRAVRTGYKVVSFDPARNQYTDFLTGFVAPDGSVWGRPVGVTVAHDGALLVSDDAGGTIWRVTHD